MAVNLAFCNAYRSLLSRPNEPFVHFDTLGYEPESIRDAAARACPVCLLIREHIQLTRGEDSQEEWLALRIRVALGCDINAEDIRQSMDSSADIYRFIANIVLSYHLYNKKNVFHFSVDLGHRTIWEGQPAVYHNKKSDPIHTVLLLPSTSARCRLTTIRGWMQDCVQNHTSYSDCLQNNTNVGSLPGRLICINCFNDICLAAKDDFDGTAVRYATVSHRWCIDSMPKLIVICLAFSISGLTPCASLKMMRLAADMRSRKCKISMVKLSVTLGL
jgi:hypothetical protein